MWKGTQGNAYRTADLDSPGRTREVSSFEGGMPPPDKFEGGRLDIRPPFSGRSSTSTSTSGWATLIPAKVGPSSSRVVTKVVAIHLRNVPCTLPGVTVVCKRTPSSN